MGFLIFSGRTRLLFWFLIFITFHCPDVWSQPFVDPFQVRYMYGIGNSKYSSATFAHLWTGSDLPIKLKSDTYLLLSPTFEQWQVDSPEYHGSCMSLRSLSCPVGLILPVHNSKFSVLGIVVPRSNGEKLFAENTFQFGGALLAIYARKPDQKFRVGVYTNAEFFGLFVIPLLGIDWQMDEKNYLFGNLPGRLTYEHQWNKRLYGGVTFRSITNSFRRSDGTFIRLEDNQVSGFIDYYPVKNFCITFEPGFGFLRKIRKGLTKGQYVGVNNWEDGFFLKLSGSYRIRLK